MQTAAVHVEPLEDVVTTSRNARAMARRGEIAERTAMLAPGMVQGNVAILPVDWADEFLRYCTENPKPCPIVAIGRPGDPGLPSLGADIDIRTDLPKYRVFEHGEEVATPPDILEVWRDDLVTFVLGCSYTFEQALLDAGLPLRHMVTGTTVSTYVTNIETVRTERFHGPMVVSMRLFEPAAAIRAIQITSRFPISHGAPVHIGLPEAIGIDDLSRPEFGDPMTIEDDELPVFWACGVTPQVVVTKARPPLFISHFPGAMLVTDLPSAQFATS